MAENLQKRLSKEGYPPLIVYNRTASRADPLKTKGAIVGKVFCECSTIHPDVTREIERAVIAKKAEFVAGYFRQLSTNS